MNTQLPHSSAHTPTPVTTAADTPIASKLRPSTMDSELAPWDLYDLAPAVNPDAAEDMREYFRRFRATRNKVVEGAGLEALQRSWCAFVKRWNLMTRDGFLQWLDHRDEMLQDHSLAELRQRLCGIAWDEDRFCYVHLREGCSSCSSGPRPTQWEWDDELAERPLSAAQNDWIAKYSRSLSDSSHATSTGGSRRQRSGRDHGSRARSRSPARWRGRSRSRSPESRRSRTRSPPRWRSRSRSRSPPRAMPRTRGPRPERLEEGWRGIPMYHLREGTPANAPGTYARSGSRGWWRYERDYGYERQEGLRAPQCDPRSNEYRPPNQLPAEGLRVDTSQALVARDDVDLAMNRALDAQVGAERAEDAAWRAERTVEQIHQSNQELRRRVRELEDHIREGNRGAPRPRQRAPGSDGSMARRARREGRSTHAPPA